MSTQQARSLGISLGIHAIILLLLMFLFISSPIPPWEEGLAGGGGGGSFVEFGTLDVEEAPIAPQPVAEQTKDDEILTSDLEETVTIDQPEKKKEKPEPVKKPVEVVKKPEPVKNPPVELAKVEPRKPDESSLYKKRGNSGNPSGSTSGTGTGGEGTGDGGGKGPGTGPGSGGGSGSGSGGGNGDGTGMGFDLSGRNMRVKPRLEETSQETGTVVIDVIVDKDGNVTSVNGPGRGSTTSAPVLVNKAKKAAAEAKFSKSDTGVEEQRGTITFIFKFK